MHPTERIFADVLAEKILDDPNRAMNERSAFCFFARSERWRAFAAACLDRGVGGMLAQLLAEVDLAVERVSVAESASLQASLVAQPPVQKDESAVRSRIAKPAGHLVRRRLAGMR